MQFSTINNPNFEKPSRYPSDRTKGKKKKNSDTSQVATQIGSAYVQSLRKCSNIGILVKTERKE
jgi:hypothetical protein